MKTIKEHLMEADRKERAKRKNASSWRNRSRLAADVLGDLRLLLKMEKGLQLLLSLNFVLSQPVSMYRGRKRVNHAEFRVSEGVQVSSSA